MATDRYAGEHGSSCPTAIEAFEQAVAAVAAHRPDAADALAASLQADPDMIAAHAVSGFGAVMLARRECIAAGAAQLAAAKAAALRRPATPFEQALLDALELAVAGRLAAAVAVLDEALEREPRSLLLAKLSHGLRFLGGDLAGMAQATGGLLRHWHVDVPGYGFLLGCHAFALEENGAYDEAERTGRRAVLLEPRDAWGMHAVAHVYEMRGRVSAGIGWLVNARPNWQGCHNFRFHMAWHLALFLLEEGRTDEVLSLYDEAVRPVFTDDFRDIANASSLLWRLHQEGVAVGDRWDELAEIARRRRHETILVFASLHQLLALVATGDQAGADELIDALAEEAASGSGDQAAVAGRVGLPMARLIAGRPAGTSPGFLLDVAERLPDMGGSNAQRDVFMRTLVDHAASSGDARLLRRLLDLRHQIRHVDRFATEVMPARASRRSSLLV
ncbi:tetratricopeptide repeat protein [Geminicoccus roseus]|uniref:tetratricopeptide repeat protein n=1 Tax=Geminicoccus roseus TaxID=404900 RepID=UPI00042307A5|nr:tetratricopeptide repeat protein [Geminicoccus roseus]